MIPDLSLGRRANWYSSSSSDAIALVTASASPSTSFRAETQYSPAAGLQIFLPLRIAPPARRPAKRVCPSRLSRAHWYLHIFRAFKLTSPQGGGDGHTRFAGRRAGGAIRSGRNIWKPAAGEYCVSATKDVLGDAEAVTKAIASYWAPPRRWNIYNGPLPIVLAGFEYDLRIPTPGNSALQYAPLFTQP